MPDKINPHLDFELADSDLVIIKLLDNFDNDGKLAEKVIVSLMELPHELNPVDPGMVFIYVCKYFGVSRKETRGNIYNKLSRRVLNISAYLIHYLAPLMSYRTIAPVLGFNSHTMVLRAIREISHMIAVDDDVLDIILTIRQSIIAKLRE